MKGDRHQLVIESLANSGDGVGRINNKVVFVPHACPGDKLEIEITLEKKNFAKATIVKIVEPSSTRVEPPCPVFGNCGGCDWQHIDEETQLKWKRQHLIDTLERIGKLEVADKVKSVVASPKKYHYRNRLQVHSSKQGLFFYGKGSKSKVFIEECLLADQSINEKMSELKGQRLPPKFELAIMDKAVEMFTVDEKGQSELGFRQVNDEQNQAIVNEILNFVSRNGVQQIVDLYCGQGNWSRAIHSATDNVECTGIDINPTNIAEAQKYAKPGLQYFLGDATEIGLEPLSKADLVIIDPPRAGCSQNMIELLVQSNPPLMAYISCHPATLARDLSLLNQQGWEILSVAAIDMFPQTAHLESLCFLRSAKSSITAN